MYCIYILLTYTRPSFYIYILLVTYLSQQPQAEEGLAQNEKPSSTGFDDQRGIKPIDVIKAGTSFTGNKMVATPIPSPLSLQQQEWTSTNTTLPSPMYQPRESNGSVTSSPVTSPVFSPTNSWSEDQQQQQSSSSSSSSSLPTPTLTPRPTTEPHQTKHMSLNNILC